MADQGSLAVVDGTDCNGTSFARGGPIYMANIVGPITCVNEFEASVVVELESLQTEVCASGDFGDELNIDDLKNITEEKLVEKALEEDFEASEHGEDVTQHSQCSNGKIAGSDTNLDNTREASNLESSSGTCCTILVEMASQESVKRKRKRGREFDRDIRAADLKGSLAKVEKFAKLKKKQDEDKEAARLHSFDGSSQPAKATIPNSEKIERLRALKFITSPLKIKSSSAINHIPISDQEIVLCVEIHGSRVAQRKQEFLVLGKQKLTELRDSIYCLTDKLMESADQYDPSGYFLIENFFYNDFRSQSAIDYSEPILNWLSNCKNEAEEKWEHIMNGQLIKKQKEVLGYPSKSNLPIFQSKDMDSTRFCDLRFRLGAGYLYCHQGDCKHALVIRDMRLIHSDDSHNMAMYPIRTYQYKLHCHKCDVCFLRVATKVTVDDKWAKKNPCYFCDNCYYLLHYDENGSLLYSDFTVYDNCHT